MTLQEIKKYQSQIFSMELKISVPWVINYVLGTTSSNFTLNDFGTVKSAILN